MPKPKYNPQKALLVDHAPVGDGWIHELKLDGFRMGVFLTGRGAVRIISRRGTDYSGEFPEVTAAAKKLKARTAVLDGEVVVLDDKGLSNFQLLQKIGSARRGLTYFAFDLLELDGEDLEPLPLEERKRRLRKLVGGRAGVIRFTEHVDSDGGAVFENACRLGAEGIISKRRDAPYRSGERSADWQKIKCTKRQEFVVGGFTDPQGSRVGVGSLLIGYYERGALRFAGKVGTGAGWNDAYGRKLRKQLEAIETSSSPYDPSPRGWLGKNAHWVKPKLVAEIEFAEWTGDGRVRHPSLQGFRADKRPRDVVREREVQLKHQKGTTKRVAARDSAEASAIVYPRLSITSADLAELYSEIADWALPHVENRPLTLVRMKAPITRGDALRSQAAFAHHTARDQKFFPAHVPIMRINEKKKIGEYRYVNSAKALLSLVHAGVIEWHAWNARIDDVEKPDRVIFDIDPGPRVAWAAVVKAARQLRSALQDRDLESWVKTTGGKGLHVVVPFRREHDWDSAFAFSRDIAAQLADEEPERYTIAFDKRDRGGKVLIDYKRNYRTSIAVAGFSTRARPDGAMSVPVRWEELARLSGGSHFTVENIRQRLGRLKVDPWKEYWSARQRLRV